MKKKETTAQQDPADQNTSPPEPEDDSPKKELTYSKRRIRIGLMLSVFGYLMFLLGARPSLFDLDRSRVIGFVQISVFLLGLGAISLGSYLTLNALWPEGKRTIAADIGPRVISTGYVICIFTAMADIFGMGSHPLPDVFFGPLQAQGMMIGMATIALGFLLMIRYKRPELKKSPRKKRSKQEKKQTSDDSQANPMTFNSELGL